MANDEKIDRYSNKLERLAYGLTNVNTPEKAARRIARMAANEAYALIARIIEHEEKKLREQGR